MVFTDIMCVCVYVCMYVCVCACMCACMCVIKTTNIILVDTQVWVNFFLFLNNEINVLQSRQKALLKENIPLCRDWTCILFILGNHFLVKCALKEGAADLCPTHRPAEEKETNRKPMTAGPYCHCHILLGQGMGNPGLKGCGQ